MRKGSQGNRLSHVDNYRRRIGEKDMRKSSSDSRIKESLHSRERGTGKSKLKVTLAAVAIVATIFIALYVFLFTSILARAPQESRDAYTP